MPVFGWSAYHYQSLQYTCTLNVSLEDSFPIFIATTEFIIPMILISFCYGAIFINLRRNSRRMRCVSSVQDANWNAMH